MAKDAAIDKGRAIIQVFIHDLRRRKIAGSFTVAKRTAELLRIVISTEKWKTAQDLITRLHALGKELTSIVPHELAIGNIVRQVLHVVREQYRVCKENEETSQQPSSIMANTNPLYASILSTTKEDFSTPMPSLKSAILDELNQMIDIAISDIYNNVAEQAIEHIHSNEVVLTYGKSQTVLEFLKAAARKRKFEVIVAESLPSYAGHTTASHLSACGISTTLVSDAAIFAMMSRVNKVIIGTHAVLADGGLIAHTGIHALALAASHHRVPVVVCTGLYKLCPVYSSLPHEFNLLMSPSDIMDFDQSPNVEVYNPTYDYIPPNLVNMFITNDKAHSPSYVYRLLSEHYSLEDYEF